VTADADKLMLVHPRPITAQLAVEQGPCPARDGSPGATANGFSGGSSREASPASLAGARPDEVGSGSHCM